MDQIQELEGPAEQNELAITKKQLQKANEIIEDHKRHLRDANETIKKLGNEKKLALTEAEGNWKAKLTEAEGNWKAKLTGAEGNWKAKLTNAEAKWKAKNAEKERQWKDAMTTAVTKWEAKNAEAKRNWESDQAKKLELTEDKERLEKALEKMVAENAEAKRNWESDQAKKLELTEDKERLEKELEKMVAENAEAKRNWESDQAKKLELTEDKERLEKALEKMDVSLAAKNMDGLSWLLFSAKFTLEAVLAGLEFHANKDTGMKFLIPAIIIAFLALLFNGWEVFRSCKEKKVIVKHKMHWYRVPWFPEIYSFIIILLEFGFYLLKLHISKPVHVSPYTCMLHMCILVQKLILRQKLKAARARRVIV